MIPGINLVFSPSSVNDDYPDLIMVNKLASGLSG